VKALGHHQELISGPPAAGDSHRKREGGEGG